MTHIRTMRVSNTVAFFFFFKQKTAYEIVSRDWSSDVCSSDLYTGTHDHDTIRSWWEQLPDLSRVEAEAALKRARIHEDEPWWALIRLAFDSPGVVAMVQMQDVLGLGGQARMNVPGLVADRNWSWRLEPAALTPELAARLRQATAQADRLLRARAPTGRSAPGSGR